MEDRLRQDRFTRNLLQALKDPNVGKAVRDAVNKAGESCPGDGGGEEAERLREEIQRLRRELEGETRRLLDAQGSAAALRQKIEEAARSRDAAEKGLAECREEAGGLRKSYEREKAKLAPFVPVISAFEQYCAIADKLPDNLADSLPRDNAVHFLVVGSQRDTIERFWDRFRERADELSESELEAIVSLLEFFLNQYNSLYERPIYRLMREETGVPFDDRRHTRSSDCSRYQGHVERVVFPGIWHTGQNKALRKSVVYFC